MNWSVMPRATYELFLRAGFQTVEQVAAIADHSNTELPTELRKWPKKAKIFLESADSTQAQVASLTERLEKAETLLKQYEDKLEMMVKQNAVN
jgi:predicted nuclease with TOPRIM domain